MLSFKHPNVVQAFEFVTWGSAGASRISTVSQQCMGSNDTWGGGAGVGCHHTGPCFNLLKDLVHMFEWVAFVSLKCLSYKCCTHKY